MNELVIWRNVCARSVCHTQYTHTIVVWLIASLSKCTENENENSYNEANRSTQLPVVSRKSLPYGMRALFVVQLKVKRSLVLYGWPLLCGRSCGNGDRFVQRMTERKKEMHKRPDRVDPVRVKHALHASSSTKIASACELSHSQTPKPFE